MSKEQAASSGQSGERLVLKFEQLNPNEKAVVQCLRRAGAKMKIGEIVEANGWGVPCKTKGNSMVRNALRRLVRSGMVVHNKVIGDGTYLVADVDGVPVEAEPRPSTLEPAPVVLVEPEVTVTVAGEVFEQGPNPRPITDDEILDIRRDFTNSDRIKKTDCAFYNACLDQAISGKWEGFACTSCEAYKELDSFQKAQDHLGLAAVRMAAELVEKYGGVCRVRGVKPGAEAKRSARLEIADPKQVAKALDFGE